MSLSNKTRMLVLGWSLITGLGLAANGQANPIFYELNDLGGGRFEYLYTVENQTTAPIDEFTLWFDLGLYENLLVTTSALDWDPLLAQPDSNLPDDGFADWLALGSPLAVGESLSGFAVAFDWLGGRLPGSQFFEIVDSFTFDVLSSGFTQPLVVNPPNGVPEPSTGLLLLCGIVVLAFRRQLGLRARLSGLAVILLLPATPVIAGVEDLATADRQLVSKRRVGRAHFEYTYTATLSNSGGPLNNVVGTVVSTSPNTQITNGTLTFGDVANGAVQSTDTFSFRQNRRVLFNPGDLVWTFAADEPVQNNAPIANAGTDQHVNTGATVALNAGGSTDPDEDPLTFAWVLTTPTGSSAVLDNPTAVAPSFVADVSGSYSADLEVSDGSLSDTGTAMITASVTGSNAPVISSQPVITGSLNSPYSYDVQAEDADVGDELTYRLLQAPAGMSIHSANGLIGWNPASTGPADVDVEVEDSTGLTARQIFLVQVNNGPGDQAPSMAPIAAQVVVAGQTLSLMASGTDPESEALRYGVVSGPTSLAINSATGAVSWTPGVTAAGNASTTLSVADPGGQQATTNFLITVLTENINNAPQIAAVADQTVNALAELALTLTATDADAGDLLAFSLNGAPAGISFDGASGAFNWTPDPADAGTYPVTATVTDSAGDSTSTNFVITVVEPPIAPVAVDDEYTVALRDTLNVAAPGVLGNDRDGNNDVLSASNTSLPDLGSLDSFQGDGAFTYSPPPVPPIEIGLAEQCRTAPADQQNETDQQDIAVGDIDADGEIELVSVDIRGSGADLTSGVLIVNASTCAVEQSPDDAIWTAPDGRSYGAAWNEGDLTLVNLDADPELEIVTAYWPQTSDFDAAGQITVRFIAMNADGTPVWGDSGLSERVDPLIGTASTTRYLSPSAVDLDGDGTVELVVGVIGPRPRVIVFSGATGEVVWDYMSPDAAFRGGSLPYPWVIADLDLDGTVEIIYHNLVLSHTGALEFTLLGRGRNSNLLLRTAVANVDNDPFPELITVDGDFHTIYEHTGTVKSQVSSVSTYYGSVTVAQLDEDPLPEYVVVERRSGTVTGGVAAYDTDQTLLWTHHNTAFASSFPLFTSVPVAFDFDRDGIDELAVHIGRTTDGSGDGGLFLFAGEDGSLIEKSEDPLSDTVSRNNDFLTMADVDGDGAAELIYSIAGPDFDRSTLRVMQGTAGNPWAPARAVRNQWLYAPTQVNADASIPRYVQPHWLIPGLNSQHATPVIPGEGEDTRTEFTYLASDGAQDSNEATVTVNIAVTNAPTIVSTPPLGASPGFEYQYPALATDADFGDNLTWTLVDAPNGMSVSSFGIVTWTPGSGDLGAVRVALVVTDASANTDTQAFTVQVLPPVTVPDLLGNNQTDADTAVANAGLAVGSVTQAFSLDVPVGDVLSQSVAAGTSSGAGSFVDYVVSLGPPPIYIPQLVGLTEATASTELEALGATVGTVALANDDVALKGSVVVQSISAGTKVALGAAVDLVVSSGPSLRAELDQQLIGAGNGINVSVQTFDENGQAVAVPGITLSIQTNGAARGSLPTVAGSAVNTSPDTLGGYQVTIDAGTFGSKRIPFVVRASLAADDYLAPVAALANTASLLPQLYAELTQALQDGDVLAVQPLAARLQALHDGIDLDALADAHPATPELGFLPTPAQVDSAGFDRGFGLELAQSAHQTLANAFADVDSFVAQLNPGRSRNDDVRHRFVNQVLMQQIENLAQQSISTGVQYAVNGQNYELLTLIIPARIKADLEFALGLLADNGLLAGSPTLGPMSPAALYAQEQPVFFTLGGMMSATSIRSSLIKDLYVPYLTRVVSAALVLVEAGAVQEFMPQQELVGIITGASASVHSFNFGNSIVEGVELNGAGRAYNIKLVGPDKYQASLDVIAGSSKPKTAKEGLELAKAVVEAAAQGNGSKEARSNAIFRGCFFDQNPQCAQLVSGAGFPSVHSSGALPAPVLFMVRNRATHRLYTGVYLFAPSTN